VMCGGCSAASPGGALQVISDNQNSLIELYSFGEVGGMCHAVEQCKLQHNQHFIPDRPVVTRDQLNDEQRLAHDLVVNCNDPEGSLTVMLGGAGTGKSFVIHAVVNTMTEMHGPTSVLVTSTTGRSAALIGGSTVHGANGLNLNAGPRGTVLFQLTGASLAAHQRKMQNVKVVILDESSMASQSEFMVAVYRLRQGRAQTDKRFGG
jgi:hypothetical protein